MPIKFRCEKCRQFLGISRSLAGQVVDCPTCGRATRVPNLDGTRKPIPKRPAIKPDSSLLSALDQLADLGKSPTVAAEDDPTAEPAQAVGLSGAQKPIPIEPLAQSAAIDPPSSPQNGSAPAPIVVEAANVNTAVVLQSLADQAEPAPAPMPSRSRSSLGLRLAAVAFGGVLFAGGFFLGKTGPKQVEESDRGVEAEQGEVANAAPAAAKGNGLTGRITYRREGAECLHDRGARVLVWPVSAAPEEAWSADEFRATVADKTPGGADKLRGIGGGLVLVEADGTFEIQLPSGGEYEVLVSSRYAARNTIDGSEPISAAHLARLKRCFDEPQRLIGKTQFRLMRVKYRGEGMQLLDCVFTVE